MSTTIPARYRSRNASRANSANAQNITLKVLSRPFSAYLYFNQPYTGREVLYVDGRNNNELTVLDCGFKRHLGKLNLDPNGTFAMSGQKYPITNIGIRYLTAEIINVSTADLQYGESEVKVDPNSRIGSRPATLIQITHPVQRKNFRAYISRIFLDNELHVPIHYDAYSWPEKPGDKPATRRELHLCQPEAQQRAHRRRLRPRHEYQHLQAVTVSALAAAAISCRCLHDSLCVVGWPGWSANCSRDRQRQLFLVFPSNSVHIKNA